MIASERQKVERAGMFRNPARMLCQTLFVVSGASASTRDDRLSERLKGEYAEFR
jgi:hypothetical protein